MHHAPRRVSKIFASVRLLLGAHLKEAGAPRHATLARWLAGQLRLLHCASVWQAVRTLGGFEFGIRYRKTAG